jgi:hypothetical protein
LRHPETWCALATLAPDIGRLSASVRKRLDRAFAGYLGRLAAYMPGNDEQERGQNFIILFSGMAGAMAMARALGDRDMRERVLTVTREHYLTVFAGKR